MWKYTLVLISIIFLYGDGIEASAVRRQIKADFDVSGAVDFQDFFRIVTAFSKTVKSNDFDPAVDLNLDGNLDGEDVFLFADVFTSRAPQAGLEIDSGPNREVRLQLEPAGNGFLIFLQGPIKIGGYRILFTVPDTVSVDIVQDHLRMGLLPVRKTEIGVEIVGVVLGDQVFVREGKTLIAGIKFKGDITGVALKEVVLRGKKTSFDTGEFRGQRNSLSEQQMEKIPLGDIVFDRYFLDFGDVTLGESEDLSFRITNTFNEQQRLGVSRPLSFKIESMDNQIKVSPKMVGALEDSMSGLSSGASLPIKVNFLPMVNGPFSSLVKVRTNRTERSVIELVVKAQVFGLGEGRQVQAFADFDNSKILDYKDLSELVSNFGTVPVSSKFDLDRNGVIGGEDTFLFTDLIGENTGIDSSNAITLVKGANGTVGVRAQWTGEEIVVSTRNLKRLGGYRILLDFNINKVKILSAQDLSGGGLLPILKTKRGSEVVGLGIGTLVSTFEYMDLVKIQMRALKGENNISSLVDVSGAVFRGNRGERDSVEVIQIGTAGIDASLRNLDFGSVRLGGTQQLQFKIFNLNSKAISFEIVSTKAQVTTRPRSVGNLGPGKVWEVEATFSPTNPGSFSSILQITTSEKYVDSLKIQVKGSGAVINVDPNDIWFGNVFLGEKHTRQVIISNPNLKPFTIEDLEFSLENLGFSLVDPPVLPSKVLAQGGKQVLGVQFLPSHRDSVLTSLQIVGKDTTLTVNLSGRGVEINAKVSEDSLDFGGLIVGEDTTGFVTLSNLGNIPFLVDNLSFVVGDSSFSLVSSPEPQSILKVGSIDSLSIRFSPYTAGVHFDTLRILGSDTILVALSGSGFPKVVEIPEEVLTVSFGRTVTLNQNLLHFGNVPFGESRDKKLRIENQSGRDLSFSLIPTDFQVTVKPGSLKNLPPNRDWDVIVSFTPVDEIQTNSRLRISTDNPVDGSIEIQVKTGGPMPLFSPTVLNFDHHQVAHLSTKRFKLRNFGNSNFVVRTLSLFESDSSFVLISTHELPFIIAANGGEKTFGLNFQPRHRGVFSDTLRFNGADTSVSIPISGIGMESILKAVPDSLFFGMVRVGEDRTLDLKVVNEGRDIFQILQTGLLGSDILFSIVSLPVLPDTLLSEGGEFLMKVKFAPNAKDIYRDNLQIIGDIDTLNIPISGTGTETEAVISSVALDFGSVTVGEEKIKQLVVTNLGNIPLEIWEGVLLQENVGFALVNPTALPDSILGETGLSLEVGFSPEKTGLAKDTLRLVGRDTTLEVKLSGIGNPSYTVVFGESVILSSEVFDFGELQDGTIGERILKISNKRKLPINLVIETQDEALITRPGSLRALPGNQDWEVMVTWEPLKFSPHLQRLSILVDNEEVAIPVGRGEAFGSVSPESLNFGRVKVGDKAHSKLTLYNHGFSTIVLQEILLGDDSGFSLTSSLDLPDTISSGEFLRLQVQFIPSIQGNASDIFQLVGRDTTWIIPVSGDGIQPKIEIQPKTLHFGNVISLRDSSLSLQINNSGNGDFVIDSLKMVGINTVFSLISRVEIPSTIFSNGGTDTLRLTMRPIDLGTYSDTLLIFGMGEVLGVPLFGESKETSVISTSIVVTFSSSVTLDGDLLDFGDIPGGATRRLGFKFYNQRDTTVTFSIESTNNQVTVRPKSAQILAFQKQEVSVSFTPVQMGLPSGVLKISTTAPEDGITEIQVQKTEPPVRVIPSMVDFGKVTVGKDSLVEIIMENLGNLNFYVNSLEFVDNDSTFFLEPSPLLPDTIPPKGGRKNFSIKFSPFEAGIRRNSLKIVGEDTTLMVLFSGIGSKSVGEVVPMALDFGILRIGQDSLRILTMTNTGNGPLVLDQVFFGQEDSSFILVEPFFFPDSIGPNQSWSMHLKFFPKNQGSLIDTLVIAAQDTILEVPLSGFGQAPPRTIPGPIALDLDLNLGEQGVRLGSAVRGQTTIDLAATERVQGISGFEVVLAFNPSQLKFDSFSTTDLFEEGVSITTLGKGNVQLSVAFLGTKSAERDSGSLGKARFVFQEEFSGEAEVALVLARFATSVGLEVLEIGLEGSSVIIQGTGTTEPNPDFNGDGSVDFSDFLLFAQKFGGVEGSDRYDSIFDLDSNGDIGFSDFLLFAQVFGTSPEKNKPAF